MSEEEEDEEHCEWITSEDDWEIESDNILDSDYDPGSDFEYDDDDNDDEEYEDDNDNYEDEDEDEEELFKS